jgi:hypothetical protein
VVDGGTFRPTGGLNTGTLYADGAAPYRIVSTPQISAGGTLFVAPGVTIQSALNQGLYIAAQGGLMVLGTTDNPVVFTSTPTADKKAPGQWSQLWFEDKSVNLLQNCMIEYGGSTGSMPYANSGALGTVTVIRGARLTMLGTTVRNGYRNGVYVSTTDRSGVAPVVDIENCTFTGNAQGASAGDGLAQGGVRIGESNGGPVSLTFTGNQVLSNGTTSERRDGLLLYGALSASLANVSGNTFSGNNIGVHFMPDDDLAVATLNGNTFTGNADAIRGSLNCIGHSVFGSVTPDVMTGNTFDGIAIDGGTFRLAGGTAVGTLLNDGVVPYRIVNTPTVGTGSALWIAPGVQVQSANACGFVVQGAFYAVGTGASPILFTSTATAKAPGQWGTITFAQASDGEIAFSTVEYGGGDATYPALVTVRGGSTVSIHDSLLRQSKRMAIYARGQGNQEAAGTVLSVVSCTLMDSEQVPVAGEPAIQIGDARWCTETGWKPRARHPPDGSAGNQWRAPREQRVRQQRLRDLVRG